MTNDLRAIQEHICKVFGRCGAIPQDADIVLRDTGGWQTVVHCTWKPPAQTELGGARAQEPARQQQRPGDEGQIDDRGADEELFGRDAGERCGSEPERPGETGGGEAEDHERDQQRDEPRDGTPTWRGVDRWRGRLRGGVVL